MSRGDSQMLIKDFMEVYGLACKRIRGANELEIFRNYTKDVPSINFQAFLFIFSRDRGKDDERAAKSRQLGESAFRDNNYTHAYKYYVKSLRYATYNGREYALTLESRCLLFFEQQYYKSCLIDIDRSLEAEYPKGSRPKLYILKARCLQKLGDFVQMKKVLKQGLKCCSASLHSVFYKTEIEELKAAGVDKKESSKEEEQVALPVIEKNPQFLYASNSVQLKNCRRKGLYVTAKQDIARGDILFTEKAYTFAPLEVYRFSSSKLQLFCNYCLKLVISCIPCMYCTKHIYCDEQCRDTAWDDFHQWECGTIRRKLYTLFNPAGLALRIILKAKGAAFTASQLHLNHMEKFGNENDNYPFIYSLPMLLDKFDKNIVMQYAAVAAIYAYYLQDKTDFFDYLRSNTPSLAKKSNKQLFFKLGALIIRHCAQFHRHVTPVRLKLCKFLAPVVALSMCPSVQMMQHSCVPNTTTYFVDDTIVVKATEDIKMNEEIYRSYVLLRANPIELERTFEDDDFRKEKLLKDCFYTCYCKVCTDIYRKTEVTNGYLCQKCKGTAVLQPNTSLCICLKCSCKFEAPLEIVQLLQFEEDDLFSEAITMKLEIAKEIYAPTHCMMHELYQKQYSYYTLEGDVLGSLEISKEFLNYLKAKVIYCDIDIAFRMYAVSYFNLKRMRESSPDNVNWQQLGVILGLLEGFVQQAKGLFEFCYPQQIVHVSKLEEEILWWRVLHVVFISKQYCTAVVVFQGV